MQSKLDLIERTDPKIAEYLRLQSRRFDELTKYVKSVINSRKSINEAFNARLERLERGKNERS